MPQASGDRRAGWVMFGFLLLVLVEVTVGQTKCSGSGCGCLSLSLPVLPPPPPPLPSPPDLVGTLDWRERMNLMPGDFAATNQGISPTCWAHAATDLVLALWILKDPKRFHAVRLQPQELIDCIETKTNRLFPNVSSITVAFEDIKKNNLCLNSSYLCSNYSNVSGKKNKCAGRCSSWGNGFSVKEFHISANRALLPLDLQTRGPLFVGLRVDSEKFSKWGRTKKTVPMDKNVCGQGGHAALLIGWTKTYWIFKNSYGPEFGVDGYFIMEKEDLTNAPPCYYYHGYGCIDGCSTYLTHYNRRSVATPPAWSCPVSYYGTSDGCDCECGAFDPDCLLIDELVYNCDDGTYPSCSTNGTCVYNPVPAEWNCSADFFGAADGCDCMCGLQDPDCVTLPKQDVFGCDDNSNCENGTCILLAVPSQWICSPWRYNDTVTCDCECGVWDPDCGRTQAPVSGCNRGSGPTCNSSGMCLYRYSLPAPWTCPPSYYANGDGCDCQCGSADPDCANSTQPVSGCPCEGMKCQEGYCVGFCNGVEVELRSAQLSVSGLQLSVSGLVAAVVVLAVLLLAMAALVKWKVFKTSQKPREDIDLERVK